MSFSLFFCVGIIFWIYVYYKNSKLPPLSASLLPLTSRPVTVADDLEHSLWNTKIGSTSTISVELAGFLLLRCWTNLYVEKDRRAHVHALTSNSTEDSISRHGHSKSKFLTSFYNFGSLVALFGQFFAVGMLWWTTLLMFGRYYRFFVPGSDSASALGKRGLAAVHPADNTQILAPRLLIPGFNIPLSHIYPIIIVLLICTGIHESGHAITASLEKIPLTKWGYNIFVVIPAAFVELLPSKHQHPLSRIRVASSGVFHNFITIAILYMLSSFHLRELCLPFIGYSPLEDGVRVIRLAQDSPLSQHISPGAIITQINDTPIKSYFEITTLDSWSNILLGHQEISGWCLQPSSFHARPGNCCYLESTLASGNGTCFTSYDETENGCIDPLVVMEDTSWPRCDSNVDCSNDNDICVRPHPSTSLLRIIFRYPTEKEKSHIIVWNGSKQEISEQITLDNFEPRYPLLWQSFPFWLKLFMEYMNTVSFSLFLLNLLPIRALDGGELFLAITELILPKPRTAESFDLESRTVHTPTHRAKSILIFLERTTIISASSLAISSLLPL